ncbi:hypothetical protein [Pseudomonas aeruginosa]|uniref:hypothetical protein n=1 Tax=Pseudomonas aeruginosa TaxID=287 RepID=UPI00287F79A6|nr:hypothetical protein [Pseudomonas aeruginosa]
MSRVIPVLQLAALSWIGVVLTFPQLVHQVPASPFTDDILEQLREFSSKPRDETELNRLRAENAALQVIVKSASFNKVIEGTAPAVSPLGDLGAVPMTTLPPLPAFMAEKPPYGPVGSTAADKVPGGDSKEGKEGAAKDQKAKSPAIAFKPIRITDNGSLLYLAADGNIRVSAPGTHLYGVNGAFVRGEEGKAELEISGSTVWLPLIGE